MTYMHLAYFAQGEIIPESNFFGSFELVPSIAG